MVNEIPMRKRFTLSRRQTQIIISALSIVGGVLVGIALSRRAEVNLPVSALRGPFMTFVWRLFLSLVPGIIVALSAWSLLGAVTRTAVIAIRAAAGGVIIAGAMQGGHGFLHLLFCTLIALCEAAVVVNLALSSMAACDFSQNMRRRTGARISDEAGGHYIGDCLFLMGVRVLIFIVEGAVGLIN